MQLRVLKYGLAVAALLFFVVLITSPVTHTLNPDQPDLVVDRAGRITQDGILLANLTSLTELKLAIADPQSTADIPLTFTLHFSKSAENSITPQFKSLLGNDAVNWFWTDDQTLQVLGPTFPSDSYPYLDLTAATDFFMPSVFTRIQLGIADLQIWEALLILVIITGTQIFYYKRKGLLRSTSSVRSTPPAELSPIEMAILDHSTLRPQDFLAFLYALGARGYLQIIEREGHVVFIRTNQLEGLRQYEQSLLVVMFPEATQLISLQGIIEHLGHDLFSAVVSQLYVEIYASYGQKGYMTAELRQTHLSAKLRAIAWEFLGTGLLLLASFSHNSFIVTELLCGAVCVTSGLLAYYNAQTLLPLSLIGQQVRADVEAFIRYLGLTKPESDARQDELFYQYFPYAVVGGVSRQWLARFPEANWYIPDWYIVADQAIYTADSLLSSFERTVRVLSELLVSVKDPNVD